MTTTVDPASLSGSISSRVIKTLSLFKERQPPFLRPNLHHFTDKVGDGPGTGVVQIIGSRGHFLYRPDFCTKNGFAPKVDLALALYLKSVLRKKRSHVF
jgi:hypothetical protein